MMRLSIANTCTEVGSREQLRRALAPFDGEEFREIWLNVADGPALCAVVNRELGWLMYLRQSGDAGFSSRNPSFVGTADEVIAYRLSNGQVDEYPASWAFPLADIVKALEHFVERRERAPFITWHDDSR